MLMIATEEGLKEYKRLVEEGRHTQEELNMALYGMPKLMSMKDIFPPKGYVKREKTIQKNNADRLLRR